MAGALTLTIPRPKALFLDSIRAVIAKLFPPRAMHGIVCAEVTYKTGLKANVYRPFRDVAAGNLPVVICLAGGGYINAPKIESQYPLSKTYPDDLTERGFAVICPQYSATNVNGGTIASAGEDAIEDMHDLMGWIEDNAAAYGFDAESVWFFGISAGGQTILRYVYGDHAFGKPTNVLGVFTCAANFILKSGGVAQVTGDETVVETGDPEAIFVFMSADERYEPADSQDMLDEFDAETVGYTDYTLTGTHGSFSGNSTLSSGRTVRQELVNFVLGEGEPEPPVEPPEEPEEADIWVPDDYSTIQAAINAATAGMVIGVRPTMGPYVTSGINLNKAVTLRTWGGAQIAATTAGSGTGIEILSDNCSVIGNFTLINFGEGIAVAPDNTVGYDNVTIQGLGSDNGDRLVITSDTAATSGTQFGMWITGEAWDVRYVEIDRVRRSYSGDIDYCRVFGRDHYFLRCYFHGINLPSDLAPLSGSDYGHTDCFQFYNQNTDNQRILIDCTWEECIFTEMVQGMFIANEFVAPDCISGLTITNCVFWGTSFTAVSNLVGMPSHGIFLGKEDAITDVSITNCTFRLAANVWTLDGIPGSTITIENCIYDGLSNTGTVYSFQSGTPKSVLSVGTGNWLYRYSWFGSEGGFGADITGTDPQLGASLLGASTEPWGSDAGWRPAHVPAQSYGPQMVQ
jgi:hypothetical protein